MIMQNMVGCLTEIFLFPKTNYQCPPGIRLQDIPVHNKVVTKALNRLPLSEMEARNRRLKQGEFK